MTEPVYDTIAAFAARLAALGVTDAVISPGSRSTPLTLCFDAQPRIRSWIQLDERSAGFFALGLGRASGRPAVLVCTSGTAAANYLPAVVEASHAGIPMIVCTADRPPELRGWGSPQTIDQVGLYGTAVRWSIDLPVPDEASVAAAAGWADAAVDKASGPDPGPVHLNWPLREPLEPEGAVPVSADRDRSGGPAEAVPASSADRSEQAGQGTPGGAELTVPTPTTEAQLSELAEIASRYRRGVVVVGPWPGGGLEREQEWAAAARRFAGWAGWPVIAEPITQVRGTVADGPVIAEPITQVRGTVADGLSGDGVAAADSRPRHDIVVATGDHLLADETLGDELRPDVAVLVGRTATTKPVRLWLERTRPRHVVLVDPVNRREQAVMRLTGQVHASVEELGSFAQEAASVEARRPPGEGVPPQPMAPAAASPTRPHPSRPGGWLETWQSLDVSARSAIDAAVADGPLLSARTARGLIGALPDGAVLVATNSLPVRDLDAFVFNTGSVVCCANRGAAGIDGSASTALGIAAADPSRTVALYTGDLALLHDLSGLAAAARLGLHLIAVCVDNDGGEIFSLLPVVDSVPAADFERLFRTPHGLDLCGLDGFAGIRARQVKTAAELDQAVRAAAQTRAPGVDLLVVDIDRDNDVAQRRALTAAAQQAARQALSDMGTCGAA